MSRSERLLLTFTRCNAPARADAWSDWYDDVHLPELIAAGADVVTRFELTQLPVPGMPSIGFSMWPFTSSAVPMPTPASMPCCVAATSSRRRASSIPATA